MAKFERFRPKLKPGKLTPQGEKLLFETEAPYDQIVLPVELTDFFLMCNGEHSVGDIIETIYHRKGSIQFKSIYRTLTYLKSRGFLENGDDLEVSKTVDSIDEFQFLTFKPFFEISIGKRIFNESEKPLAFYVLSMIAIVSAILSLQHCNLKWLSLYFLHNNNSFLSGLIFVAFTSSVLLSAKNFFKGMLLIFLTGRAYNFGLVFNGFSFYFRVKSDSLFLVSNRLYLTLFHLAVTFCYFPIVAAVYFFFPNMPYMNDTFSLAFLLFLFDLNPYQDSEGSYLMRSFFNDDTINKVSNYMKHKSLLSLVQPFERNRDNNTYFFYVQFVLIWSALILSTTITSLYTHSSNLFLAIKTASAQEKLAALAICSYFVTLTCIVLYNSSKVLFTSFFHPLKRTILNYLRKKESHSLRFYNNKEVSEQIENLPLFNYFSPELLGMIVNRSELKEYNPSTPVIVQGDDGTHLYVLMSGRLEVRKRTGTGATKIVSEILPPGIFGENAVVEDVKRMADVVAIEKSIVLQVPAKMLRQIATDSQYIRELDSFRNAIMVNQFFTSAPIFRDRTENVIQMFTSKGKIESFIKDQIIFKQGDQADGFYLLLRGSVGVSVNSRPISRIQQGGFFGEVSMITDVPRTATIYALEEVQVLKISRDSFWEILSLDINMAMFIESVGEMRVREDIEIIKASAARVA
jgi:CRP-like cAMP-binding protein